jgi:tetratricopeptide (TPR) repeat protein
MCRRSRIFATSPLTLCAYEIFRSGLKSPKDLRNLITHINPSTYAAIVPIEGCNMLELPKARADPMPKEAHGDVDPNVQRPGAHEHGLLAAIAKSVEYFTTGIASLLSVRWMRAAKQITTSILSLSSLALIGLFLALVVQGLFAHTISIQAITTTEALEKRGFTSDVAAQRLRDALVNFLRTANTKIKGTDIELQNEEPNIIVPAVNLSLDAVIATLRTFFKSDYRRNISGDITESDSKLWLRLRLNGKIFYTSSTGVNPNHPDDLFDTVARDVLLKTHPYVVASETSHTNNAKALELVNAIIDEPDVPQEDVAWSYNLKATILRNRLQYTEAIEAARKAIALDPQQANPRNTLGAILRDLAALERDPSKLEEALGQERRALELDRTFALPHEHLAESFRALSKNDDAIAELQEAIKLDPRDPVALSSYGHTLLAVGRSREARQQFLSAIDRFRKRLDDTAKHALVRASLANALMLVGHHEEARSQYNQATTDLYAMIEADSNNIAARKTLAWALQMLDRHEDAIREYHVIIKASPKDASMHLRLGNALRAAERASEAHSEYELAVTEFEKDINFQPRNVATYLNLAAALRALGKVEDAIKVYQDAAKIEPDNGVIHAYLGFTFRDAANKNDAIQQFRLACDLDPYNAAAHRALAELLESTGGAAEAIDEYRRASNLEPADASLHLDLVRLLKAVGKDEEAIAEILMLSKMDPKLFAWENGSAKTESVAPKQQFEHRPRQHRQ